MKPAAHVAISCLVVGLIGETVGAFPFPQAWHTPATGVAVHNRTGGGGIYGTGGRSDHGIKCKNCHIPNPSQHPGTITMNVTATPAFEQLGADIAYKPNQRYTVTVHMVGEHLLPPPANPNNNANAMALTIENASGVRAGRYIADSGQDSAQCSPTYPFVGGTQPPGATTFVMGDCHGVLPLLYVNTTSWTFDWVAPNAGSGDLTMFVGMVDGNNDGSSSLDDDAIDRAIALREGT